MMDPKVKEQWLAALRSGDYRQGWGGLRLRGGRHHCCLGVLMDVRGCEVDPGGFLRQVAIVLDPRSGDCHYEEGSGFIHPENARRWGLTIHDQLRLAEMNDAGDSFKKIADWIEKNL
jgi:hypothetical protein